MDWEMFNETTLPEKEEFYSNLWKILQIHITCMRKRVFKDFEIKNLGEYHGLYLKNDTLLLAPVFINVRKTSFRIYHLDL